MKSKKLPAEILVVKKRWETAFKKGWGGGRDFIFERFLKKYKTKLGPRILDIGSGEGRHIVLLAKAGFDVFGLELTKAGNLTASKRLKALKLKATLVLGDAHRLPFGDKYFDSIISIQVFQFNDWKGIERCFSEVSRVLRKKGIFFLRVKATSSEVPKENRLIENDRGATYKTKHDNKVHFYTKEELVYLGKKYNLKIVGRPVDATNDKQKKKGQWNVVYQKV